MVTANKPITIPGGLDNNHTHDRHTHGRWLNYGDENSVLDSGRMRGSGGLGLWVHAAVRCTTRTKVSSQTHRRSLPRHTNANEQIRQCRRTACPRPSPQPTACSTCPPLYPAGIPTRPSAHWDAVAESLHALSTVIDVADRRSTNRRVLPRRQWRGPTPG